MALLFKPLQAGDLELQHRVVLAPLTRFRADKDHVPLPMVKEYYAQRASSPGTLLITEATFISPRAGGYPNVPGIYNAEQIKAWKEVTDAVHAKGSFIFCQLWALGRTANPAVLAADGYKLVSASNLPLPEGAIPEPLDEEGIQNYIQDYTNAAKNAIEAGFDGVEIHGANGYLLDQFLQDKSNDRTDRWGGSIENRSRFGLEVAKAVSSVIGAGKTGYRVSPWSSFQEMGMDDPVPQFTYHIKKLAELNLAYIHIVESRVSGNVDIEVVGKQVDPFLNAWSGAGAIILAGGFTAESAQETVEKYSSRNVAIAFGRHFISNPDLPARISKNLPFTKYNRDTFYVPESSVGYTDYPFISEA
ncbi:NADPH2 dehydrogenase [Exophiala aquamarina CBS 119918]|uniref:NADPH2 dehydrogenase n=1 Tax=Exophiala aquamarina CBS 119918 TaxID=1182545 RepID=A0A072NVT3_9EURO|nr:NADPH2 dehydrogenase [Exophiala aquamarina CBS 119918]KEF51512.1 NADPH2 dehydrogenase [Exophiala aquamarina CBS 119918]